MPLTITTPNIVKVYNFTITTFTMVTTYKFTTKIADPNRQGPHFSSFRNLNLTSVHLFGVSNCVKLLFLPNKHTKSNI